jgi:hypothetical protein
VADVIVMYLAKTQRVAELQQLALMQDLKKLPKDTQWTVEQLSFVAGHESVILGLWCDIISKFGVKKDDMLFKTPPLFFYYISFLPNMCV